MLNCSVRTVVLALVLGSSLALAGCSKDNDKKTEKEAAEAKSEGSVDMPEAKGMKFQPDAAQKKIALELTKKVDKKNWRFPPEDANKKTNAKIFTYLAGTNETPEIVGAALQGMYGSYSSHSKRKIKPDEDFTGVVLKHLQSENPRIVARALKAARTAMTGKRAKKELIDGVVALASKFPSGAGRYALIDSLRVISSKHRDEKVMAVLTSSLDAAEPYVQSYALQAIYRSTRSIKDPTALKAKAFELSKHENVGVRGRSIELLGALGKDDPEAVKTVLAALEDSHPYVRSEAAEALSRLRHKEAIPKLIKMVGAKERNRYTLTGWKTLEDSPGRLHHEGSAWGYERDAAMNAIRSLSAGALKLERVNPKKIEEGLDVNAKQTLEWYKTNKGTLKSQ